MVEEVQQWSNAQLSEDRGGDYQSSEDERVDEGGDVPMDVEDITVDPTETTDGGEHDDIIPGCCVLHIDIGAIRKVWVRAEYIRIYGYLEEQYNDCLVKVGNPGAVLMGQPGIGEFSPIAIVTVLFMFHAKKKARVSGSTMPYAGIARKRSR